MFCERLSIRNEVRVGEWLNPTDCKSGFREERDSSNLSSYSKFFKHRSYIDNYLLID